VAPAAAVVEGTTGVVTACLLKVVTSWRTAVTKLGWSRGVLRWRGRRQKTRDVSKGEARRECHP
jgi:hypothetical protein